MKLRITIDGRIYEAEVEVLEDDESAPSFNPYPPGYIPAPPSYAPEMLAQVHGSDGSLDDPKICRSPVTGLVVNVYVEPGQTVSANEVIMVLEAMKMETQLTAHYAGKVKAVHVATGNSVKAHQALVEFE